MPDIQLKPTFQLGPWKVFVPANRMEDGEGAEVQMEPRLMKLLALLAARQGEVVSKETIIAHVWGDEYVSPETLSVAIYELRKALGDKARQPVYIKTIRKGGFQLIKEAVSLPQEATLTEEPRQNVEPPQPVEPIRQPPIRKVKKKKPPVWLWASAAVLLLILIPFAFREGASEQVDNPCLAVMPFDYLAENRELSYFAEGMTEALITDLAGNTQTRVLPRRSVVAVTDEKLSPKELGQRLGVDVLVEGAVQVVDEEVRVSIVLVDAETEDHLKTYLYQKPISDFFSIQQEASLELAAFFNNGSQPPPEEGPVQLAPELYHAYLKGQHFLKSNKASDVERSIAYFKLVTRQAPGYAPAHSALATAYTFYGMDFRQEESRAWGSLAEMHIEAGLAIDDSLGALHLARAVRLFRDLWRHEEAEAYFKKALKFNPSDTRAHRWYGLYLAAMSRHDEAKEVMADAIYLAPFDTEVAMTLARIQYYQGDIPAAQETLVGLLELDPSHSGALFLDFLLDTRELPKSDFFPRYWNWVQGLQISPDARASFGTVQHLKYLDPRQRGRLLNRNGQSEVLSPITLAKLCRLAGKEVDSLIWLNRALREHHHELIWLNVDPLFKPLAKDIHFKKILREIGVVG